MSESEGKKVSSDYSSVGRMEVVTVDDVSPPAFVNLDANANRR